MRIVFCTKGDRMRPSSRTRAFLIADYLREQGYDAEAYHIKSRAWWDLSRERFSDLWTNFKLLRSIGKEDVLYLHKLTEQLDFMLLVLVRKWIFRRDYLFDFDDAIFLPTPARDRKTRLMVRHARAVFVGSHYLQEYASRYNSNVSVVSAPIDTKEVYMPARERVNDPRVRIGWTGGAGHYDNMKLLLEPLRRIVADGYKVVFVQVGGGKKIYELLSSVEGLPVEYHDDLPWDQPKEIVKYLQQFDIGVMPLEKNEHERGKDGWKAKEYMGCAVATVLTDWGENPYIVQNNVNGILASSIDDWYQALERLITDERFRKQIGDAGRRSMIETCSYDAYMKALAPYFSS